MIRPRKRWVRVVMALGACGALIWLSGVRLFAFAGESMSPAVEPGDRFVGLVGLWGLRAPKRFDLAIFDVPSTSKWAGRKIPWMKRLVGLPGEHVRLSGAQLFIDGRRIEAPFLRSERRQDFAVQLGEREYFVLGDNLDSTLQDSRAMGPIPSSLMKGVVWFVLHASSQKPNKVAEKIGDSTQSPEAGAGLRPQQRSVVGENPKMKSPGAARCSACRCSWLASSCGFWPRKDGVRTVSPERTNGPAGSGSSTCRFDRSEYDPHFAFVKKMAPTTRESQATAAAPRAIFSMKLTSILLGLALTAPLIAADASKILLSGTTVSVEDAKAVGLARAVVGDMTISADAITFEKPSGILKCDGAVTIRVAGNVVTSRDCAIQLSPGEKKLAFLSRGEIQLSPRADIPFAPTDLLGRSSDREQLILEFRSRTQPGNEPDKAPDAAPGSIPPRAKE